MSSKEDFYVRPSALTKLLRGNEFFLMRWFNTAYGNGMYTLPSGVIDGGETAKEAAIRETYEEAGVILNPGEVTLVHTLHRKLPDGKEWFDLFSKPILGRANLRSMNHIDLMIQGGSQ